jgi:hypothetical protein
VENHKVMRAAMLLTPERLKNERTEAFKFHRSTQGRGHMKGEGKYRAFYDDIVASKQIWMEFFDLRGNALQAEHTCALLVRMLLSQFSLLQLAHPTKYAFVTF